MDEDAAPKGNLDLPNSSKLRDAFNLENATVIQPFDTPLSDSSDSDEIRYDNYLHTALANSSGLPDRIPTKCVVAIGPGRGPYQWASAVWRQPPARRGLRIISLSGRVLATYWNFRPLDADDAAIRLHQAFDHETSTRYRLVGLPTLAEEQDVFSLRECPFKADGTWNDRVGTPQFAVIGAGALGKNSGHRVAQAVPEHGPQIERYIEGGRELMTKASELGLEPLGDLVNRVFATLPFPSRLNAESNEDLGKLTEAYKTIGEDIAEFNQHLVTANWDHLRSIPTLVVIAGGKYKHNTLWTVLLSGLFSEDTLLVKEICTDLETAEVLLNAKRDLDEMQSSNSSKYEWFRNTSAHLFKSSKG